MERDGAEARRHRSAQRLGVLLALATCAALLWFGLGERGLEGDEAIYVTVADRASELGRFAPLPAGRGAYIHKPPLAIWSIAAGARLFGDGEAAHRAAAAVAAWLLCCVTLGFGRALRSSAAGALGALLLATAPNLLHVHGLRSAVTEPLLLLAITASFWVGFAAAGKRRLVALAALSVANGLTKGAYGPIVVAGAFALAGIVGAWRRGRQSAPGRVAALGEAAALAAASFLPGVAAYLGWLRYSLESWNGVFAFLRRDLVERVSTGVDPSHLHPPSLYWETVARDFGPFLALSLLALVVGLGFVRREEERVAGRILLLCWVGVVVAPALGSVSRLPWYVYPAYPALALAAAVATCGLVSASRGRRWLAPLLAGALLFAAVARAQTLVETWPETESRSLAAVAQWTREEPGARAFVDARLLARGDATARLRQWNAFYLRRLEAVAPGDLPGDETGCRLLVTADPDAWWSSLGGASPTRIELQRAAVTDVRLFVLDLCDGRFARRR